MPKDHQSPATLDLTVIQSANKTPVRKIVALGPDGRITSIKGYPGVRFWTRTQVSIQHDIDVLADFIRELSVQADCCLVTGEPIGLDPLNGPARRLKHQSGNDKPTLSETAAAWLPVDCDKIPLNSKLDPLDPEYGIGEVVEKLGVPFSATSYVWQLTASATPGADRLSIRLFFLVDQAITNDQRKAWATGLNAHAGVNLVDTAPFNAAQPIYTAAPEFHGQNPFPRRCGVVYGEQEVVPWSEVQIHQAARTDYQGDHYQGRVHRSIAELLASIGDGPGQEGFHSPITSAIWQMVYHRWTVDRIKSVIREAVNKADSSRHEPGYLRSETSDAALNRSIKGAEQRIKASLNAPRVTQTRIADDAVPLDVAVKKIRTLVSTWLRGDGPSKLVIDSTVGGGKTHETVKTILEELPADAKVLWAFPTHDQGQEVLEQFNSSLNRHVAVRIEGRVREGESVTPLCARPDVIRKIKDAGLSRYAARIACSDGKNHCPHWHGCAYYRQFRGEERVRLVPHALLPHHNAQAFSDNYMARCAGLVIDESPLGIMVGRTNFLLEKVQNDGGVLADVITAFRNDMHMDADITVPLLEAEMKERCVVDIPSHGPAAGDEWALMQELSDLAENKRPSLIPLYRAAIARVSGDTNVIWFGTTADGDSVFCAWKHNLPAVDRVLVLDGTADRETYRALLGDDVHIERIAIEQNVDIIQAYDLPLGKGKLTDPSGATLAQVVALARSMSAGVISNKAAIEQAQERGWLPDNYPVGHFNALRGVNSMSALSALVIAGRPEPDALTVEAMARALWPREALNLTGAYRWTTDGVSSVASHPDPHCDGLLRMLREAEINQAIGRLRAVRSSTRKTIVLLTHTPTGLPVTSAPFADIVPPAPLARLLLAGNGIAPLAKSVMSQLCHDIWLTPERAKEWLKWNLKGALALNKYFYKANAPFKFRVEGQRRHSIAVGWLDEFDAWAELERLTGAKVVECQRIDPSPAPEPANAPAPEPEQAKVSIATADTPVICRSSLYGRLMAAVGRAPPTTRWKPPRQHPPPWRDWLGQFGDIQQVEVMA